jgi:hypothetical protein
MDTLPPLDSLPSNYKILPIVIPSLIQQQQQQQHEIHTDEKPSSTIHNLYLKPHTSTNSDSLPSDKTLYITNLPKSLSTRSHLKRLFRRCGPIDSIQIATQSSSGQKIAYVVFGEETGVKKVLEMKKRRRVWLPLENDDNADDDEQEQQEGDEEGMDHMVGLASEFPHCQDLIQYLVLFILINLFPSILKNTSPSTNKPTTQHPPPNPASKASSTPPSNPSTQPS